MHTFRDADELIRHLRYLGATLSDECHLMTELDHGLQTAALLRQTDPDDFELQVAGLVHDLAHSWDGPGQTRHAAMGATAVRCLLGERVAGFIESHVPAKRYLVAALPEYYTALSPDSVFTLKAQGGPMRVAEVDAFEADPEHLGMIALRVADDGARIPGAQVPGLDFWIPTIRSLCRQVREPQHLAV